MSNKAIKFRRTLENARALDLPNDVFNEMERLGRAVVGPTPPPLEEIRTDGKVLVERLKQEARKGATKNENEITYGKAFKRPVLSESSRMTLVTRVEKALQGYIEERENEPSPR